MTHGSVALAGGLLALRGAGATFPAPLYQRWINTFAEHHPNFPISYEAVGSGEGVRRFLAEEVDFAGSDAALSDEEMAQVKRGAQLVPATAGIIVIAYHVKGLSGPLKLPRDVYSGYIPGKITRWNDSRIQAANPDLKLPNENITIAARQDSSGTTYAFTNHLSAISQEWRDRGPGIGKVVDWPGNAMVARGNEGVAARIKISEGSIGYMEYGFAKRLGLPMAWLENKTGRFVEPNDDSGAETLVQNASTNAGEPEIDDSRPRWRGCLSDCDLELAAIVSTLPGSGESLRDQAICQFRPDRGSALQPRTRLCAAAR